MNTRISIISILLPGLLISCRNETSMSELPAPSVQKESSTSKGFNTPSMDESTDPETTSLVTDSAIDRPKTPKDRQQWRMVSGGTSTVRLE